jgi:hypothetical protein
MNGIPELRQAAKIFDSSLVKGTSLSFYRKNQLFFKHAHRVDLV